VPQIVRRGQLSRRRWLRGRSCNIRRSTPALGGSKAPCGPWPAA